MVTNVWVMIVRLQCNSYERYSYDRKVTCNSYERKGYKCKVNHLMMR